MEILNFIQNNPNVNITMQAGQWLEVVDYAVAKTKAEYEKKKQPEQFRKPKETAEQLGCDLSTLWRWNKSNYLKPIEIGGKRRYRQSDIDRILNKES